MWFRLEILVLTSVHLFSHGQASDSLYEYQSFELTYENDIFTGSDRYYSQGIFLHYKHHNMQVNWLERFFFHVPDVERNLQTGLEQKAYTPSTILSDTVLFGDRPYAGTVTYGAHFFSRSRSKNYILSWGINTGFIGRAAFGEQTQKTIHKWTKNATPLGWQH